MEDKKDNKNILLQYASIGTQICVSLALMLYIGMWLDKKLSFSFPILVWVMPLAILIVILTKLINDTSKKK